MGVVFNPFTGTFDFTGTGGGGGGGTPGAPFTSVQFNNSGSFGGSANFVWANTAEQLQVGPDSLANTDVTIDNYVLGVGVNRTDALPVNGSVTSVVSNPVFTQNAAAGGGYFYNIFSDFKVLGSGNFAGLSGGDFNSTYNGTGTLSDGPYGVVGQATMFNGSAANIYGFWEGLTVIGSGTSTNAYGYFASQPN